MFIKQQQESTKKTKLSTFEKKRTKLLQYCSGPIIEVITPFDSNG